MRREVQYLLEITWLSPVASPWSSPCILVPKPDGTSRSALTFEKSMRLRCQTPIPYREWRIASITLVPLSLSLKLDLLKGY
uniref:Reverse transcriptase domain-containing protein n=1 Tax=Anguilla anguilla TaxID=7936 RepID=A0A0E9W329_ANGAN